MDTEKQTALTETYQHYLKVVTNVLPYGDFDHYFSKDLMAYGTTADEIVFSAADMKEIIRRQEEQSKNIDITFSFEPVWQHISEEEDVALFTEAMMATVNMNGATMQMHFRLTSVLEFMAGKWKIVHWHASKPEEVQSEVDTFGIDEWKQRASELEKTVAERTADLVKKNEELQTTLEQLKATQTQLVHSEKMASLGELTAGIAHEIQNPLNFVNNFSEVSNELIDEMNIELDNGDIAAAKAIAGDVKQNLEKIVHHGKRADGIVKGMLQHSRSSNGQKESTNINELCDEYLRLSYHGLRAKDKSFNATLNTSFDESIGEVKVVPQDIGRVILNLLTNAFYAVKERQAAAEGQPDAGEYEPTVSISTSKAILPGGPGIQITVTDNGSGIPAAVQDKIFQPFFTTKPTGQGTGLGLSMSYDIVTKGHGGDLKMETSAGVGTSFIIILPS